MASAEKPLEPLGVMVPAGTFSQLAAFPVHPCCKSYDAG